MPSERGVRLQVYGIRSCDSCRNALKWLQSIDADYEFHDLREGGLPGGQLDTWLASPYAPSLLNRRSTTWRQLPGDQKLLADRDLATLLARYPTLIKRPVITEGEEIVSLGFDPERLKARL